jgi:hypothetical protein
MFELATGRPPFTGETLADLVRAVVDGPLPSLPAAPELEPVVASCLVRDRNARCPTILALATELEKVAPARGAELVPRIAFVFGETRIAEPRPSETTTSTTVPDDARARPVIGVAIGLAVALVVLVVFSLARSSPDSAAPASPAVPTPSLASSASSEPAPSSPQPAPPASAIASPSPPRVPGKRIGRGAAPPPAPPPSRTPAAPPSGLPGVLGGRI